MPDGLGFRLPTRREKGAANVTRIASGGLGAMFGYFFDDAPGPGVGAAAAEAVTIALGTAIALVGNQNRSLFITWLGVGVASGGAGHALLRSSQQPTGG